MRSPFHAKYINDSMDIKYLSRRSHVSDVDITSLKLHIAIKDNYSHHICHLIKDIIVCEDQSGTLRIIDTCILNRLFKVQIKWKKKNR